VGPVWCGEDPQISYGVLNVCAAALCEAVDRSAGV
jgi:hypothetical protein